MVKVTFFMFVCLSVSVSFAQTSKTQCSPPLPAVIKDTLDAIKPPHQDVLSCITALNAGYLYEPKDGFESLLTLKNGDKALIISDRDELKIFTRDGVRVVKTAEDGPVPATKEERKQIVRRAPYYSQDPAILAQLLKPEGVGMSGGLDAYRKLQLEHNKQKANGLDYFVTVDGTQVGMNVFGEVSMQTQAQKSEKALTFFATRDVMIEKKSTAFEVLAKQVEELEDKRDLASLLVSRFRVSLEQESILKEEEQAFESAWTSFGEKLNATGMSAEERTRLKKLAPENCLNCRGYSPFSCLNWNESHKKKYGQLMKGKKACESLTEDQLGSIGKQRVDAYFASFGYLCACGADCDSLLGELGLN